MARLMVHLLGLLAIGTIVSAAPPTFPSEGTHSVPAPSATRTKVASATAIPSASSTAKISIPDDVIQAAPVQNHPVKDPALASIPGKDNSTLVQARPELQAYVNDASAADNKTTPKRSLVIL